MKKTLLVVLVIIAIIGITSTIFILYKNSFYSNESYSTETNEINPPKADDTNSTSEGIEHVVTANNQFAFDLYLELVQEQNQPNKYKNIFYSPYSIFSALAITYEGAREQTAKEIKNVLHLPDNDILRPNIAAIYNSINTNAQEYELNSGNALWVQKDFPLLEEYTNIVEKYYASKATNLDFENDTENSRKTINDFISKETKNKIPEILPQGTLSNTTRLVITNAIYFKGTWKWEFDKDDTFTKDFYITPTQSIDTEMMHMYPDKAKFNYAETNTLQILELPYKGDDISMLILLPKNNLTELEKELTLDKLNTYKSQMRRTKMSTIAIPKFEFDTTYTLNDTLQKLGMSTAFSDSANFSGMTKDDTLAISSVIHKAYIKTDESGTEATGATAVIIEETAIEDAPIPPSFIADHPFIFIIQQKKTGNILFIGRIVDPTK